MSESAPPLYTTFDSVKVRLANKVQFQENCDELQQGELPNALLSQLIADAETAVEQDLRSRYSIPFRAKTGGTWMALPDHSRRAIRRAVDLKAVWEILRTDFGRGTHIAGDKYSEEVSKEYDAYIAKLLGRDQEGAGDKHDRYRFSPPLDGLLLAPGNSAADDGYKGRIINTDGSCDGAENYAAHQINDPSRSWMRRRGQGLL